MRKISDKAIRRRMIDLDITWAEVSRQTGISREAISQVLHGHAKTAYIRKAIADALRWPPEKIWPDYDPEYGHGLRRGKKEKAHA